jgi:AAA family ATP:ADP antiporter
MGYVPLYSWFSSKVNRMRLILGLNLFFLVCIELFYLAVKANIPYVGVAFFIWCGIFSLSVISQFWSLANDVYSEEEGKRLFPVIAIGATLGSPIGSQIASVLFDSGMAAQNILQISALLLIFSSFLYWLGQKKRAAESPKTVDSQDQKLSGTNGFTLIFRSRYLLLMAGLFLVLNLVNTTGEFILSSKVVEAAHKAIAADPSIRENAFIGSFYGKYFFGVNVIAFLVQAFLVSRIVKYLGIKGAVMALPLVALGAYTTIAIGAGLAIVRWMKTAENATDYSVMNTARAMLWLPTSREEKYKAKQAIDTFVVRFGDVLSAGFVFAGLNWFALQATGFALINLGLIAIIWIPIALLVLKEYRRVEQAGAQKVKV